MKRDEFLQVIRSPFHFATCDAVLRGCKIVDISKPPQWRRMSKKVRSPLDPLCEGTPPAGGGGENCTAARNISGYGKVLSLRPFGAPPSQREVFRHAEASLWQGRLFLFGIFFHLFCAFGAFFDCFAQIGCFYGSYYTIMIKHWRMYIFTARLLRLEL